MATYLDIGAEQSSPGLDIGGEQLQSIVQLVGSAGIPSSVAFGSGGKLLSAPFLLGRAGIPSSVAFGTGGIVQRIIQGSAGIPSSVRFGVGGTALRSLIGHAGIPSSVKFGVGGSVLSSISGRTGIPSSVRFGTTGALVDNFTGLVKVMIAGVDRTSWVGTPIRRSAEVGSRGTCDIPLNNKHGDYRPDRGDEVVIYWRVHGEIKRFFCGIVDSYDETQYSGTSAFYSLIVKCLDYGARLDSRIVGRVYPMDLWGGFLPLIIADVIRRNFADLGVTGPSWTPATVVSVGDQPFNWLTGNQTLQQGCDAQNWDFWVDYYKLVRLFDKVSGWGPAPVAITTNSGKWQNIRVTHAGPYRNREFVRNSQDYAALWTDTIITDGTQCIFPTMVKQLGAPVFKIDGVEQTVADIGKGPIYWLPWGIFMWPPPPAGKVVEVIYPSPLSYVTIKEDAGEIAAKGRFDALDEVSDVANLAAMDVLAQGFLDRGIPETVSITLETDEPGFEPGQVLTVNTLRPPLNDTFLIERVDSEEQGKKFFRHVIKASNTQLKRLGSSAAMFERILAQSKQPKDRTTVLIASTLAETVEGSGSLNPGLTVGQKDSAVRIAEKDGVARGISIYFQSSNSSPAVLTTQDCEVDILQNGVSIFGTQKLIWPAGAYAPVWKFYFRVNPLEIKAGDVFVPVVIRADSAAKDGIWQLTELG